MSMYTTGEIAKLCGVSVRTVQYYDTRNILVPSELSEGGRRLYSEEDLKRMKIICFLRDLDLPINTISRLLTEEHPENVIDLLLEQQEAALRTDIADRQAKLNKLELLQREVRTVENFSVESIGDIAHVMENKKKLRRLHMLMLTVGIPLELVEWITFFYGWNTGTWWPYLLGLGILLGGSCWMVAYYYKNTAYICPQCHAIFIPKFQKMLWAYHTPSTRKLTCTACGHRGFCVETYRKEGK